MSTAILKAEVQTRIDALVYSSGTLQAAEVLQLAVDTVGLELDLTNIIAVHASMTSAITAGTSEDDLTALNAASIALGITSNGVSSNGAPIDSMQVFLASDEEDVRKVMPDGAEWLRTGYIETDVDSYPDAKVKYDNIYRLAKYDTSAANMTGSGFAGAYANNHVNCVDEITECFWLRSTVNGQIKEFDKKHTATGRTIDFIRPVTLAVAFIGVMVIHPVSRKIMVTDASSGHVYVCNQDGTDLTVGGFNIMTAALEGHTAALYLNLGSANSVLFYRKGVLTLGYYNYNSVDIYTFDENFKMLTAEKNPQSTPSTYYMKGAVYDPVNDRLIGAAWFNNSTTLFLQNFDFDSKLVEGYGETSVVGSTYMGVMYHPWETTKRFFVSKGTSGVFFGTGSDMDQVATGSIGIVNASTYTVSDTVAQLSNGDLIRIGSGRQFTRLADYNLSRSAGTIRIAVELTFTGAGTIYSFGILNDRIWFVDYTNQTLQEIDSEGVLVGAAIPLTQAEGQTNQRHMTCTDSEIWVWTYNTEGTKGAAVYDENGAYLRFQASPNSLATNYAVAWDGTQFWTYFTTKVCTNFGTDLERKNDYLVGLQSSNFSFLDDGFGGKHLLTKHTNNTLYVEYLDKMSRKYVGSPVAEDVYGVARFAYYMRIK